ncbi:hypothetical protein PROFUN_04513 [Planoprotostelium fungivorum]|uniref:Uncharacterized protein n=1 Tax=Planoprotostelium fungivorum TaxID=1890364 RepID=A0A2P6NBF2_9EUKA|nr:hypothetical protein PROFUN_04513 [Planoprotostelium fungivorum]
MQDGLISLDLLPSDIFAVIGTFLSPTQDLKRDQINVFEDLLHLADRYLHLVRTLRVTLETDGPSEDELQLLQDAKTSSNVHSLIFNINSGCSPTLPLLFVGRDLTEISFYVRYQPVEEHSDEDVEPEWYPKFIEDILVKRLGQCKSLTDLTLNFELDALLNETWPELKKLRVEGYWSDSRSRFFLLRHPTITHFRGRSIQQDEEAHLSDVLPNLQYVKTEVSVLCLQFLATVSEERKKNLRVIRLVWDNYMQDFQLETGFWAPFSRLSSLQRVTNFPFLQSAISQLPPSITGLHLTLLCMLGNHSPSPPKVLPLLPHLIELSIEHRCHFHLESLFKMRRGDDLKASTLFECAAAWSSALPSVRKLRVIDDRLAEFDMEERTMRLKMGNLETDSTQVTIRWTGDFECLDVREIN